MRRIGRRVDGWGVRGCVRWGVRRAYEQACEGAFEKAFEGAFAGRASRNIMGPCAGASWLLERAARR